MAEQGSVSGYRWPSTGYTFVVHNVGVKPSEKRRLKLNPSGIFGKRIDRLIRATGWRQSELPRHFGISAKAIRRVRYGRGRASVDMVLALQALESLHRDQLDALDRGLVVIRGRSRYCFVDPLPEAIRRPADLQGIGATTWISNR